MSKKFKFGRMVDFEIVALENSKVKSFTSFVIDTDLLIEQIVSLSKLQEITDDEKLRDDAIGIQNILDKFVEVIGRKDELDLKLQKVAEG